MRRIARLFAAATLAVLAACTPPAGQRPHLAEARPSPRTSTPSPSPAPSPPKAATAFDPGRVLETIRVLAQDIGRREATSPAYRRAAEHVGATLRSLGYSVRAQTLRVPAGVSWGVDVPAGETFNVIAEPPGFDPGMPHAIVGAHLDTVPQSPGANDNASGVAGVIELARLAAAEPPPVPVVFVAFAAEEPRGSGDGRHHYGSRVYVARMDAAQREALAGMISLDRIGYGSIVEVCTGGAGPRTMQHAVLDRARELGVRAETCTSRTSDHWSFEKADLAGVRLGGRRNPGYHSSRDSIGEIDAAQIGRVGVLTWAALRGLS